MFLEYHQSAVKPLNRDILLLERGLIREGAYYGGRLIREGDLLIIQGKKCFKNAPIYFFCYGKAVLMASKVY